MDRATLLDLLARAEQHIALGKEQIDKQYRIIAKLERRSRHSSSGRSAEAIY